MFIAVPLISIAVPDDDALVSNLNGALLHPHGIPADLAGAVKLRFPGDRVAGRAAGELVAHIAAADRRDERETNLLAAHPAVLDARRPAPHHRPAREHLEGLLQRDLVGD